VLILFLILLGFSLYTSFAKPAEGNPITAESTTTPSVVESDPIEEAVAKMSTDEKIGSLLILGFRGPIINEHIKELVQKYHVGGVNLLGWNITDAAQAQKLSKDLQDLYAEDHDLPFIVAADQEGGTVVRFKFFNEKTAATNVKTTADAIRIARVRANELKSVGINMNFAPVVDFITDKKSYLYDRTFATTTEGTIALGKAMTDTYLANGIMPVFKHFPGYGNSTINPHTSVTQFDGTQEMYQQNIKVFQSLLTATTTVPVMTAHIIVPWVSKLPATKSPEFMTQILRKEFKYQGVVITDDLDMASVGNNQGQSGVDAILAGADILISTPNDANHIILINALKKAVAGGVITKERLDQSAYKVLKMRMALKK
jgi:beta-N-acetylhexosaminidase